MNRALADQVKLFREQADVLPASQDRLTGCADLEDQLAFGVFLFDRLRHLDEHFRLHAAEDADLDTEILQMYRTWGKAANHCISALAEVESKSLRVRYASEFRKRCQEARGVLANEIAYVPPVTEARKKESLEELLSQVTDDNLHGEIDFGPPVGKEVW